MKNTFVKPFITIEKFDVDVITTSGNYTGYQRVIDSLATKSLNADADIENWLSE